MSRESLHLHHSAAGFTVIEMLVVLTILSVLALATLPVAEVAVKRSKERELKAALVDIRAAIDAYKQAGDTGRIARNADSSGYPPSLDTLIDGVDDAKDERHPKLFFLRRIPRDPFASHDTPLKDMWGVRSYASKADKPKPGADVYDVYSQAAGTALNGLPYRDW